MSSRDANSPTPPEKKPLRSGLSKKKTKKSHKSKSTAGSTNSLNASLQSVDHSELTSSLNTQKGGKIISRLAAKAGLESSSETQSLGSTFRGSSHTPTSPCTFALTPEPDGLPSAQPPHHLFEAAPKRNNSHSNITSLSRTSFSVPLPAAHKDPASPKSQMLTSVEAAVSHGAGGLMRKKPLLRSPAASPQPVMFDASPKNASLESAHTPSPEEATLAKVAPKRSDASPAEVLLNKEQNERSPSPPPQAPPNKRHTGTMTPSAAAAAVSVSSKPTAAVAAPVVAGNNTQSPQLKNSFKDIKAKDNNARSPPPPQGRAAHAPSKSWSPPMYTHESPEYLPTDAPNIVVPVCKYAYDVKTCTWKEIGAVIRVLHPNRGVSQGAMRVCFVVDELDERGFSTPMVAKMFRHNLLGVVEDDYFSEGEAQCICGVFADKYNKIKLPKEVDRFVISFLQCDTVRIRLRDLPEEYQNKRMGFFSYRTADARDVVFTMEPRLKGNFTKYTNNFGAVYEGFEERLNKEEEQKRHKVLMAVEAFSHFTLEESGGSMLVCDLQGVNDFLTDPQIHTMDGKGFGMGNMGYKGIDKWVENHVCNEMCRALKLTPLKGPRQQPLPKPDVEARVSYYKVLRSNLRSQTPTLPEDIIPLSKPLSEMTDEERLDYALRLSQLVS